MISWLIGGVDGIINETLFAQLETFITTNKIDVVIFDPLQDLSRSPETNEIFRAIGQRIRLMATQHQTALHLVHHTRKIQQGVTASIDDARGGSALRGTSRFNRILISMSEDEGVKAGIENHRFYFRIADAESNLAPPSASVNQWFEKVSVITPSGQSVGAVRLWQWPDAFDGISKQDAIRRENSHSRYGRQPAITQRPGGHLGRIHIAETLNIDPTDEAGKQRIKEMLNYWIKTDVLAIDERTDARQGRTKKVVIAGPNNPLSTKKGFRHYDTQRANAKRH